MRLLLIACSNRKLHTKRLLPAIERYDGGTYRIIRKAKREGYFPKDVNVKILSAKFGLIDLLKPIPYYDQKMNRDRAKELSPLVMRQLKDLVMRERYDEIFVNMGREYLLAIDRLPNVADASTIFRYAKGGIGEKGKAMKEWLIASAI